MIYIYIYIAENHFVNMFKFEAYTCWQHLATISGKIGPLPFFSISCFASSDLHLWDIGQGVWVNALLPSSLQVIR